MFAKLLRDERSRRNMSLKSLSKHTDIDASLLSRFENGQRMPTKEQLGKLSNELGFSDHQLLKAWLVDKVYDVLDDYPDVASEVLHAMESRVEYLSGPKALNLDKVPDFIKQELVEIDMLKAKWRDAKPVKGVQFEKLNEAFGMDYTFESNRIEGNTLTLQETFLVIKEGLTISGKSIQEHLEAINHDDAIDFIRDLAKNKTPINEYGLKQLHNLVLKGIDRRNAGVYRSVGVRIGGSQHVPPEPFLIQKMMEDYFVHYTAQVDKMHPVLLAAEMHERLVSIHPFIDGNGRTSRLIMNLILLRNGYTLAILKGDNASRMAYYKALEDVQINNDPIPFYTLICKLVKESLISHLKLA
ncbi:MAG: Fic family protein [Flavobacteriales bacterium]|nr:Fic family protein [Flavobacteriales bacterium]